MSISMTMPCSRRSSPALQRLDRHGWTAGTCVRAHGLSIGARTNRPEALKWMADRLPAGWELVEGPVVDRLYSLWVHRARQGAPALASLYRGPRPLLRRGGLEEVLARLELDLELHVVQRSPSHVFVHAGVVGWQGRAIVIPGRSFSGKSTLVSRLCRAGGAYYSDEYAVFDTSGRACPFPRPLRLRAPDGSAFPPGSHGQGLVLGGEPLPVGLVVITSYRAGACWRPRAVSAGEALLALLANTMSVRRQPQTVLAVLRHALLPARALRGLRGEAEETARELLERAAG